MLKVSNMCALRHRYCQIQIFVWVGGGGSGPPAPPALCLMLWKSFKMKPSQMALYMLWYNKCENLYKESVYNFSYNTGTQLETTVTFTQGKVISN